MTETGNVLDDLIEEAAMIWLRERDRLPCSIRRQRLMLMIGELTGTRTAAPVPSDAHPRFPQPDRRMLAANDHSLDPDDEDDIPL